MSCTSTSVRARRRPTARRRPRVTCCGSMPPARSSVSRSSTPNGCLRVTVNSWSLFPSRSMSRQPRLTPLSRRPSSKRRSRTPSQLGRVNLIERQRDPQRERGGVRLLTYVRRRSWPASRCRGGGSGRSRGVARSGLGRSDVSALRREAEASLGLRIRGTTPVWPLIVAVVMAAA